MGLIVKIALWLLQALLSSFSFQNDNAAIHICVISQILLPHYLLFVVGWTALHCVFYFMNVRIPEKYTKHFKVVRIILTVFIALYAIVQLLLLFFAAHKNIYIKILWRLYNSVSANSFLPLLCNFCLKTKYIFPLLGAAFRLFFCPKQKAI